MKFRRAGFFYALGAWLALSGEAYAQAQSFGLVIAAVDEADSEDEDEDDSGANPQQRLDQLRGWLRQRNQERQGTESDAPAGNYPAPAHSYYNGSDWERPRYTRAHYRPHRHHGRGHRHYRRVHRHSHHSYHGHRHHTARHGYRQVAAHHGRGHGHHHYATHASHRQMGYPRHGHYLASHASHRHLGYQGHGHRGHANHGPTHRTHALPKRGTSKAAHQARPHAIQAGFTAKRRTHPAPQAKHRPAAHKPARTFKRGGHRSRR
ncbi:hypothetical protein SAMN02949497_0969 [Methylomagnum ishizawai]|uniref:Uncharacterized protein n=1 Tax=Methylomagnum ishizawai TaxID=1760988 RepID=A0A1Y6CZE6_9GAMM|nr:hypothetical protein [Methylomagnum ishizawai]SMF93682.1 hypothetical protein SAMN02949497_0969 [Methylomagnum ishizawai]